MPYADVDGVRIYYEVFGDQADPVLVLISGGGAQMISWDDEFVSLLTDQGLSVVRFDNRDTGFSQRFGGEEDIDGGYDLSDMADDILRVLDHLGVTSAHLAGHSMGGMMAQMVAIKHPQRVRSLGLFSTIPGRDRRYILH
ncbi:alpha/beta fold hydrolase, partial [Phytoactinopolyspora endophytica]|uniref:alpha/beta fold hydrolase n=1 Tax=Phytoactinopolyspora endophytica TaxID=1642495 RepID=UPI0013ED9B7F